MSLIRSRGNRETELRLLAILRGNRITGWRRHLPLPGRPDFVFPKARLVIFVDGCFWHGCPLHGRKPDSNQDYWLPKLARNISRDRRISRQLRKAGWRVLRLWQHSLKKEDVLLRRIQKALFTSTPLGLPARRPRQAAD